MACKGDKMNRKPFQYAESRAVITGPHDGDSGWHIAYFIHTPHDATEDEVLKFSDTVKDIGNYDEQHQTCHCPHDCCGHEWESSREAKQIHDELWCVVSQISVNV
jgi:hypothetical protein